jgi:hypothetical protein
LAPAKLRKLLFAIGKFTPASEEPTKTSRAYGKVGRTYLSAKLRLGVGARDVARILKTPLSAPQNKLGANH